MSRDELILLLTILSVIFSLLILALILRRIWIAKNYAEMPEDGFTMSEREILNKRFDAAMRVQSRTKEEVAQGWVFKNGNWSYAELEKVHETEGPQIRWVYLDKEYEVQILTLNKENAPNYESITKPY